MKTTTSYADLSDHDLVAETKRLAFEERRATAALIRSLMELDARRLPAILDALEDGALTLTSARRLAPQLTADNCAHVLAAARFKSKTVIEELLATLAPKPDVKPTVRKLPQPVRPDLPHQGRCTFVGPNGRCTETSLLQFHHKDPFAMGGAPTAENICLRCAAHNRYEAELFFAVNYPGIVRETRPHWPAADFSSRNENEYVPRSLPPP